MPEMTDSVRYALRSIGKRLGGGMLSQSYPLKKALERGYVKEKNGKYVVTAKGEQARVHNAADAYGE